MEVIVRAQVGDPVAWLLCMEGAEGRGLLVCPGSGATIPPPADTEVDLCGGNLVNQIVGLMLLPLLPATSNSFKAQFGPWP